MAADTVKVVVSYSQEIDGKEHAPGDEIAIPRPLARALARRGAIQYKSVTDERRDAPAPVEKAEKKGESK